MMKVKKETIVQYSLEFTKEDRDEIIREVQQIELRRPLTCETCKTLARIKDLLETMA